MSLFASWPPAAILALVIAFLLACAAAIAGFVRIRSAARAHQATRAEAERLRGLAKDRAQRIAMLSHEVRTPLALIRGAGELLEDGSAGPLTAEQERFMTTIMDNTSHVISLTEDLLSYARLEATLFDLHLEKLDLRALVRDTVRELRALHDAPLQLDNRGRPIPVLADTRLLREALWNLANNAIRHAREGTPINFHVTEGEGQAVLAVSNEGRGVDSEIREAMFQPFHTTSEKGTGLGLTITKAIVELHGGTILVDTTARSGTTMYFTIPTTLDASHE
ncbi:hypothetical protein BSZ39_00235 [Bowdeniella nasicola]|uniref:histidine kinase n=1 Tax=Bowdeniella nasicola TaxID=208480 RepID=A0A1Q5Q5R0_9ACTO|nr:HAMP domain-containing sensor histidine kinase [Bowdeniella nasicola]OKL55168.1 hypothetical protein BSZ39_00235 [Bowdeniella nasicola]